jgi:hypothetical protein
VSDDQRPVGGSRWEPAPAEQAPTGSPTDDEAATRPLPAAGESPDQTSDRTPRPASDQTSGPEPDPILAAMPIAMDLPPAPPRRWRPTWLLAAAAAGLLVLGGIGGFGIGHATAGDGPPGVGLADAAGDRGHHRGRPGLGDDAVPGQTDGPTGGVAPAPGAPAGPGTGDAGAGAPAPAAGTGSTGTST